MVIILTCKRWLDILFCSVFSFSIVMFLSKTNWVTVSFDWWLITFNSFRPILQFLFAFLLGFLLNQWLTKLYVYGEKRTIKTSLTYPSVFVSAIFSTLSLISYRMFITNDVKTMLLFVSSEQACIVYVLIAGLILMPLIYWISSSSKPKNPKPESSPDHKVKTTYEDYKEWFKNDQLISEQLKLSSDLQVYAQRIKARLETNTNEGVHIALCGAFGTGKSSIIKCVKNQLNNEFITSNIDTWGTDSKSINGVVLTKVVADVSSYVDMSAFKGLPSQYIDALKLGNNTLKLAAIFVGGSVDPMQGLTKLNTILAAVGKKLLITIQDLDRSSNPIKSCNELSALLDRLKGLKNISFIIALAYDGTVSEVIRKVCDYREDLIKVNYQTDLFKFMALLENDQQHQRKLRLAVHTHKHSAPYPIISSERSYKHICRQVDEVWQENKLKGEVNIESLFLLSILREEAPSVFDFVVANKNELVKELAQSDKKTTDESPLLTKLETLAPNVFYSNSAKDFFTYLTASTNRLGQGAFSEHNYTNYFNRLLLETVSSDEVRDQHIMQLLNDISQDHTKVSKLIINFNDPKKGFHWIEGYCRFHSLFFKTNEKQIYEKIYCSMTDCYFIDALEKDKFSDRKVNNHNIQKFLHELLEKALVNDNAVKLFKHALTVPTTLGFWLNAQTSIELFLENDTKNELYELFLAELKDEREISKQLPNIDSNGTCLAGVSLTFIKNNILPTEELSLLHWKGIIFALLEKNSKSEDTYKNNAYFVCWLFYNYKIQQDQFDSDELSKIQNALTELNNDDAEHYLESGANHYLKEALGKLSEVMKENELSLTPA